MKSSIQTLPLLVTVAVSLFAVSGLRAQNTQNAQDAPGVRSSRTSRASRTAALTSRSTARTDAIRRANERDAFTQRRLAPRVDGSVVRAVRSGDPLQMVNPAAPAEYGDGTDVTRHEAGDPFQRPQGLRLFAVEF